MLSRGSCGCRSLVNNARGHIASNKTNYILCILTPCLTLTKLIGVVVPSISRSNTCIPSRRASASSAVLFCGAILNVDRNAASIPQPRFLLPANKEH